jgi:hypothetical protein
VGLPIEPSRPLDVVPWRLEAAAIVEDRQRQRAPFDLFAREHPGDGVAVEVDPTNGYLVAREKLASRVHGVATPTDQR